ncbi:MAG: hypothetical protein OEM89_06345 [Nitrosopumilus sp.]|nr:hypothetical protein [Nitrosopumilus sp.]
MVIKPIKYDVKEEFTILETELSKFGKRMMTKPLRIVKTSKTID